MSSAITDRASAQSTGTVVVDISSDRIASGLEQPLYVTSPPGDSQRLFIVERTGSIKILNLQTGTVLPTPFLTISNSELLEDGGEQGLLGLSFHPNFAQNGKFYVNYTSPGGGAAGQTKIVEYTVQDGNANLADPNSARTILTIDQPYANHNGGWLGFGPDGYLYIATGDGGSGGDPDDNAQDTTNNLLGKILRLNVNRDAFATDPNRNYAIPADNPFVGRAGDDEIWAYGLRNPWRPSFDRLTGALYIADVGQGQREEINVQPANVGGRNYGWDLFEGTEPYEPGTAPSNLVAPIYEYSHSVGESITGGYVYRGPVVDLSGTYFFGDFVSSRIWSFRYRNGRVTQFRDRTSQLTPDAGSIDNIASFGEDAAGNLYIVDLDGEIFRLDVNKSIIGTNNRDALTGNASPETLDARGGNDRLLGNNGNDTLLGGNGGDYLNGGNGRDLLRGGSGNDTYVHNLGDVITEAPNGGTDTVLSNRTYILGANLERLTLTGSRAINGLGNSLGNRLQGNRANNSLRGNSGNDALIGSQGNDALTGGSGGDTLTGGVGRDRFIFDINVAFDVARMGVDTVTDFVSGLDKIVLDKTTFTAVSTLSFASVSSAAQAQTSAAIITYVTGSGSLFYNANGTASGFGTGGQFANLTDGLAINRADFSLQA
ncbi:MULTISPECIES: PQQ-dependent sugar dehydrogenase [unclassified Leptolyngbya]|uniref:PQQ-dependent sugar dehydrogenase n=1 Tax=unclassified Leptolyngbya TaxID=2650499 RepID=UPI001687C454|nr:MULTISPECIES: PQQ-dependent sugar dehydrogenase [unclassified Leptolyngbya]MBD1912742.1 PQQ-dependent sugar dehydrogenase [Leptolyngbya sp. FACHB-8]MBD2155744.1 PQQ-dependent sugar dehydrogenase [Leptolyngbya sp. FACHB-16]